MELHFALAADNTAVTVTVTGEERTITCPAAVVSATAERVIVQAAGLYFAFTAGGKYIHRAGPVYTLDGSVVVSPADALAAVSAA